ncbi:hypothetical protein KKF05_05685 [Patescibacteria group bacterium]|nr:hypothetical protein [Patescibacteria group bacterium]MBU1029468.1 hypothetical protein [Patescibacteria group bacterium]MBU1916197.1 hypothetical protein [Patescibacteria group bacterium]
MIRQDKKRDYTLPGVALAAALTLFVLFLGWYIANIIKPPITGKDIGISGTTANRQYLVYRSYRVLSRGIQEWPNDDTVAYDFFRYPLDGSALRSESIISIERKRIDSGVGTPWMRQVSNDTLLFARRDNDPVEAAWIDVSGNKLRSTEDETEDIIWNGLPSSTGQKIAYYDWVSGRVIIMAGDSLPMEYDLGSDAFIPVVWDEQSNNLYLKKVSEGDLPTAGLWRLNTTTGETEEILAVRELKLYDIDLDISASRLVGATYECRGLEDCGTGPSALYLVDLLSGNSVELHSDEHLSFGQPRLSPNAKQVAYTLSNGQADVWVSDLEVAGHERRIISGRLLDWLPDSNNLVVDRDNELQLISAKDSKIVSVARRSGQYPDADFLGIDYIGIVSKR